MNGLSMRDARDKANTFSGMLFLRYNFVWIYLYAGMTSAFFTEPAISPHPSRVHDGGIAIM